LASETGCRAFIQVFVDILFPSYQIEYPLSHPKAISRGKADWLFYNNRVVLIIAAKTDCLTKFLVQLFLEMHTALKV
jgi:hypothetical protein